MTQQDLTKSLFTAGCTCPALLWFSANARDELPPRTEADLATLEQGRRVGQLATTAFPGGTLVDAHGDAAVARTAALLDPPRPVFEATFRHARLLCKVDVLRPAPGGWDIIEVKSATKVKDEHLVDVAFQQHVLQQAGVSVNRVFLMHIDSTYVRDGALDVHRLFRVQDVSEVVARYLGDIERTIDRLLAVIAGERPHLGTFHRCDNRHCQLAALTPLPAHNVTELYYSNGQRFVDQGIVQIAQIQPIDSLTDKQRIQWQAVITGEVQIDRPPLQRWLGTLRDPVCHLDFETINPAIPQFDGTRPYQHIPFQYSLHVETDGGVEHHAFLGDGRTDPRRALLGQLMEDLPPTGTVLAHNMSFEKRVLTELGQAFPEHAAWVKDVTGRLGDTIVPFRNFWYYSPEQHGSCSIKYILPALTGRSYADLEIGDGAMAQVKYARLAEEISEEERARIRADLLTYCGLDTEGMVAILAVLREAARG